MKDSVWNLKTTQFSVKSSAHSEMARMQQDENSQPKLINDIFKFISVDSDDTYVNPTVSG